jgi:protein PhnA
MIEQQLYERAKNTCELCNSTKNLSPFEILPLKHKGSVDDHVLLCDVCKENVNEPKLIDTNHWRSLNESIWSVIPAVQVLSWRVLNQLKSENWAQDILDQAYLEEETFSWASEIDSNIENDKHRDSNGVTLEQGDSVILTKDLNVKGAGFTAKRGTAIRNINLVHDNNEHIEGKINGQQIVILTKYVKK